MSFSSRESRRDVVGPERACYMVSTTVEYGFPTRYVDEGQRRRVAGEKIVLI